MTTMQAWVQGEYGGPEVVRLQTVEIPTPARGEVRLKVRAVSLNAGDIRVMRGDPMLVRAAFGLRRPRIATRGMDVAGTVVEIGEGVDVALLGTEVVGELPGGGLAEYVTAPASLVAPRDPGIDPTIAAAVPLAGGTARQALHRGGVEAGHRVLVIGASGGVGTFTVQLAADDRAEVWALCGERNRAFVERLGATRAFDYRSTSVTDLPDGEFHAVIDIAGSARLRDLQRLLCPGGQAVLVAGEGSRLLGPIPRLLGAACLSIGSKRQLRPFFAAANPAITRELLERVAAGRITPVIERTWPLAEAQDALAHVASGRTAGKVVVAVS